LKYLETHKSSSTANLLHNSRLFKPESRWLVDQDSLLELGNSTVHQLLSSKEDINLLIIDTNPYTGASDPVHNNKRDVGLYAINYGTAYVASIAPGFSYSQAILAIREAAAFPGPSIVIAHAPHLVDKAPNRTLGLIAAVREAIDGGLLSLYRWNPSHKETTPLVLDSSKANAELAKFMDRENHLALVMQSAQPEFETIYHLEADIADSVAKKAQTAFDKLYGSIVRKKLLILFGSDGGNAQSVAKRLGMEAKEKGLYAKVMAMDAYVTGDLLKEEHVLFVVSTAGQGEFPGNARETWKYLSTASSKLEGLKYTVFAMGDSHYWPRLEDAKYYVKAGKGISY
jgi:sulfite reductase (NADPH) hemoprotein beta-component